MTIKTNPNSKRVNYISLPARMGHIETNTFIYAASMKEIEKDSEKLARAIAGTKIGEAMPNKGMFEAMLKQAAIALYLNQMKLLKSMYVSKVFITFYNIVACAVNEEWEISYTSDEEYMELAA